MEKRYNIVYHGRPIYRNLSPEECTEILQDYAEKYYNLCEINPNELELEEILNG
jgi:glutamine amidotransferase-like uncharacterized protein